MAVEVGTSTLHVSAAEVFDAEEAADLFVTYHRTGDLPKGYVLRPVEGYRSDGTAVDLTTASPV